MKDSLAFHRPDSGFHIPDDVPADDAFSRTTVLGIGAHPDDLEFMALQGILQCYREANEWFGGVTCTNGSGSARTGPFAGKTDEEMIRIRSEEQDRAADLGEYSFMARLGYASEAVRPAAPNEPLIDDLERILGRTRPDTLYTHHGMDKHPTHVGIFLATLAAVRRLDPPDRPARVEGCEVWRSLDWVSDGEKLIHPLDRHPELGRRLAEVFASQIAGGKNYAAAIEGRRLANATFMDPGKIDSSERVAYTIDLTPLFHNDAETPQNFFRGFVERLQNEIHHALD